MDKTINKKYKTIDMRFKLFDIKEFIPMLVLVLGFVCVIAGCFGAMYKSNDAFISPIEYLFEIGPNSIKDVNPTDGPYAMILAIARVSFIGIGWLMALISSVVLLAITIVKIMNYLVNYAYIEFDYKKIARWMLAFASPYFIFSVICQCGIFFPVNNASYIDQVNSIGWGLILVVVGIGIFILNSLFDLKNKNKLALDILREIPTILIFVVVLLGSISMYKVDTDEGIYRISLFSFINVLVSQAGSIDYASFMIFGLGAFAAGSILLPLFARCKNNYSKIIFGSLSFVFYAGAAALLIMFNIKNPSLAEHVSIGFSIYLAAAAIFVALGLSIIVAIIDKRSHKTKKTKVQVETKHKDKKVIAIPKQEAKSIAQIDVRKIITYVLGTLMIFAVFMYFMDVIKWTHKALVENDIATPAFFDVIFGINGSEYFGFNFVSIPGMVVLFALQMTISLGLAVILILTLLKKIDPKVTYLGLAIGGVLAIACASLSFASPVLIDKVRDTVDGSILPMAGYSKLGYGGIIYGSTMMACGLAALVPYLTTRFSKK